MKDDILKAALLGTERYTPDFSLPFSDVMQNIANSSNEKEEVFLKQTALFYTLNGVCTPAIQIEKAPAFEWEDAQGVRVELENLLEKALTNDNTLLVDYCLHFIVKKSLIIPRYLVPDLIEKYLNNNRLGTILQHSGKVGLEVAKIMEVDLAKSIQELDSDEGSFAEILQWIKKTRQNAPEKIWEVEKLLNDEGTAIETSKSKFERIVEQVKVEKRLQLIQCLKVGLSKFDEEHLIKLLKSKSQQVKNEVAKLLVLIEGSQLRNDHIALIQKLFVVSVKKEFLGLSKKTVIETNPAFSFDPNYKSYGFEEISSVKDLSDVNYQVVQCIRKLPLNLISSTLGVPEKLIIDQFYTHQKQMVFKSAFIENAINFGETAFLIQAAKEKKHLPYLLHLPFEQALQTFEEFYRIADSHDVSINLLDWLFQQDYFDLPTKLAQYIVKELQNSPYIIQGKQMYRLGLYFPQDMRAFIISMNKNTNGNYFFENNHLIVQAIEDKNQLVNL